MSSKGKTVNELCADRRTITAPDGTVQFRWVKAPTGADALDERVWKALSRHRYRGSND